MRVDKPIISVGTEFFYKMCEFDTRGTVRTFFDNLKIDQRENIVLKTAYHVDQVDFTSLIPLEI